MLDEVDFLLILLLEQDRVGNVAVQAATVELLREVVHGITFQEQGPGQFHRLVCMPMSPNYTADVQYIRTIDDIFHNQQGYCMELSAAFASWCINQGVKCTVEFVPGHAVNRLYDKEGKAYPVDLTMLASSMAQFPILSDSLGATDFANVDRFYNIFMTRSQQDEINTYQQGRQDDPVNYSTIDVYRLRQWLPSFNIGGNYLHSQIGQDAAYGLFFGVCLVHVTNVSHGYLGETITRALRPQGCFRKQCRKQQDEGYECS